MEFEDTTIVCEDCNQEFTHSADDQSFFYERGFQSPKRCKPCRDAKKMTRDQGGYGGQRQMHDVTCADCGSETQVPFKPSGDRPVYCRDCYQKHR